MENYQNEVIETEILGPFESTWYNGLLAFSDDSMYLIKLGFKSNLVFALINQTGVVGSFFKGLYSDYFENLKKKSLDELLKKYKHSKVNLTSPFNFEYVKKGVLLKDSIKIKSPEVNLKWKVLNPGEADQYPEIFKRRMGGKLQML